MPELHWQRGIVGEILRRCNKLKNKRERERMSTLQKRKDEIISELAVLSKQKEKLTERISKLEFEYRRVLVAIYEPAHKRNETEKEYR
jgi:chaperonin cofactor prefoldin